MAWQRSLLSGLRWAALALGSVLGLYLLAAWIGSSWAANPNWREPRDGITIYVATNGLHTGLILPVAAAGEDWSLIVRPTDLPDPNSSGNYLLFGWGNRAFYRDTQTWSDVRPGTVLSALWGSDETSVHVDHLRDPSEAVGARPIRLTETQYRQLTTFLRATFKLDAAGHGFSSHGYGSLDVFYDGRGRYSAFNTCNSWTGDALAAAGVRVGRWTPFSESVMGWFGGDGA